MVRYLAAAIALAAAFASAPASAHQILLLDFWSPHCGPCMQMKPIVESYEQAHYPIQSVDTTRDGQLSQQYSVTSIPCFIMLVDGQEIQREVGAIGSEGLKQMFARAQEVVRQKIAQEKDEERLRDGFRGQNPGTSAPPLAPSANAAAGPAQPPASQTWPAAGNGTASHSALLAATVRLYVEDAQGRSCGTGTIVDTRKGEALVVTCGHLFRETKGQ